VCGGRKGVSLPGELPDISFSGRRIPILKKSSNLLSVNSKAESVTGLYKKASSMRKIGWGRELNQCGLPPA